MTQETIKGKLPKEEKVLGGDKNRGEIRIQDTGDNQTEVTGRGESIWGGDNSKGESRIYDTEDK